MNKNKMVPGIGAEKPYGGQQQEQKQNGNVEQEQNVQNGIGVKTKWWPGIGVME